MYVMYAHALQFSLSLSLSLPLSLFLSLSLSFSLSLPLSPPPPLRCSHDKILMVYLDRGMFCKGALSG